MLKVDFIVGSLHHEVVVVSLQLPMKNIFSFSFACTITFCYLFIKNNSVTSHCWYHADVSKQHSLTGLLLPFFPPAGVHH